MKKDNNKNIFIIIGIIALVIVLGIVLVLVTKKEEPKPSENPKEEVYKQCESLDKLTESEKEKMIQITNWLHNGINYDLDKEGNRTNNSAKIKEEHQLDGGYTISNMKIESKKCKESVAELTASFTNNSGKDIEFGTINFYFKPSDNAEKEVNVSLDVKDLKNGETKSLETSFRFRIIDAYDYRAVYVDSSQMEG